MFDSSAGPYYPAYGGPAIGGGWTGPLIVVLQGDHHKGAAVRALVAREGVQEGTDEHDPVFLIMIIVREATWEEYAAADSSGGGAPVRAPDGYRYYEVATD